MPIQISKSNYGKFYTAFHFFGQDIYLEDYSIVELMQIVRFTLRTLGFKKQILFIEPK